MPIVKPVAFATAAENIAGTAENKAIDPLGIREALNCTGDAPAYACRAWVNFNGTGTVAIRASGNVSSITDNGTGDYTVNFATAMQDANYATSTSLRDNAANSSVVTQSANSVRVSTRYSFSPYSMYDDTTIGVAIFR